MVRGKCVCEFGHGFWSGHEFVFDAATVNRLAITFLQPANQLSTCVMLFVITVACCEWLLLDRSYEPAVLFERAGNQEETLARETFQRRSVVSFHTHAQPQHTGLLRRWLLGQHDRYH